MGIIFMLSLLSGQKPNDAKDHDTGQLSTGTISALPDGGNSWGDTRPPEISNVTWYFNRLSVYIDEHRFQVHSILIAFLGFYYYFLLRLTRYIPSLINEYYPKGHIPLMSVIQVILIIIPAVIGYLVLVRIDARRWTLIHPLVFVAYDRLRHHKALRNLLILANVSFLIMVGILILSGFLFSEFGLQSLAMFAIIWIGIHVGAIIVLGVMEPQ